MRCQVAVVATKNETRESNPQPMIMAIPAPSVSILPMPPIQPDADQTNRIPHQDRHHNCQGPEIPNELPEHGNRT
jgi:hypothetical protein